MKVVLAGAFGNLGAEILKVLVREGHEVVAADLKERPVEGTEGKYTFVSIDATEYVTMKGLCDGADVVITTMGLTGASTKFTSYDIDYQGNMNLYKIATKAGVKKFNYISVISCDEPGAEKVPMLHAKYMVEQEIKKQPMDGVYFNQDEAALPCVKVSIQGNAQSVVRRDDDVILSADVRGVVAAFTLNGELVLARKSLELGRPS